MVTVSVSPSYEESFVVSWLLSRQNYDDVGQRCVFCFLIRQSDGGVINIASGQLLDKLHLSVTPYEYYVCLKTHICDC